MQESSSAYQTWPPKEPAARGAAGSERQLPPSYDAPKPYGSANRSDEAFLLGEADEAEGAVGTADASPAKVFYTPEDRNSLAFSSFIIIGLACLAPWNSILSASDYFGDQVFGFSVAYQSANVVGLAAIVRWGSRFTFRSRVIPGLVIYIVCMVGMLLFKSVAVRTSLAGVLGLVDAIVQGAIFSLSGMLGPRYVSGVMMGQGVSGVVTAALHIATKASIKQDDAGIKEAAVIFFALACVVVVVSIVMYLVVLEGSPVTKYYLDRPARIRNARFEKTLAESEPQAYTTLAPSHYKNMRYAERDNAGRLEVGLMEEEDQDPMFNGPAVSSLEIWRKVWPMGVSVFLVFLVTLACFPSLTVLLKSDSDHLNTTGWYTVIMVTLFDVGDLIGRIAPGSAFFRGLIGNRSLYASSAVRVLFVPAFVMAIKNDLITTDALQYLMMTIFSVSNGYFSTLLMMRAPDRVKLHEREQAGTIMVFVLTFGLTAGVWLGFTFTKTIV